MCKTFRPLFKGIIVANNNLNPETGLKKMIDGDADMVSFGRLYISNPDLGYRILNNKKINDKWNMATFYTPGPEGYVDYKTYEE